MKIVLWEYNLSISLYGFGSCSLQLRALVSGEIINTTYPTLTPEDLLVIE